MRSRNRLLCFYVTAAIDSRTEPGGDSALLWRADDELTQHWRDTAALSDLVLGECAGLFGSLHMQTRSARMWQLAAHGYLHGAADCSDRYRTLTGDAAETLSSPSGLVSQIDTIWRGVSEGYDIGKWW